MVKDLRGTGVAEIPEALHALIERGFKVPDGCEIDEWNCVIDDQFDAEKVVIESLRYSGEAFREEGRIVSFYMEITDTATKGKPRLIVKLTIKKQE